MSQFYWMAYRNHPAIRRHLSISNQFEAMGSQEKSSFQISKLRDQLQKFQQLPNSFPAWKEVSCIQSDDKFAEKWADIPILTKQDINEKFSVEAIADQVKGAFQILSSGGSTGEPTRFIHGREMRASKGAAHYQQALMCGWKPGYPMISVWGAEKDISKNKSFLHSFLARCRNQKYVEGYRLSDQTVDEFVQLISGYPHVAVHGFTSMLQYITERIVERGITIPAGCVAGAWSGGESVQRSQQEAFEKVFGTPFLNYYGGRESGPIACQASLGGALNVFGSHVLVEIVDEQGKPVGKNEKGRIVLTSLVNTGTPFVRYEIGDYGIAGDAANKALGVTSIQEITGRTNGLIHLPNGQVLCGLFWNHLFKDIENVKAFQVALIGADLLEIRISGKKLPTEKKQALQNTVTSLISNTKVQVKQVDEIKRSQSGKLMQIVREAA